MDRYFLNIILSIGGNTILLGILYWYFGIAQPDPKGLGFFIASILYAAISALVAIVLLSFKCSPKRFIYSWVLVGNSITIYYTFQFMVMDGESFLLRISQYTLELFLWDILLWIGPVLFFILLFRLIRDFRNSIHLKILNNE